jgi:hypothetical protein
MPPPSEPGPRIELAPLLALGERADAASALRHHLHERLAEEPVQPYATASPRTEATATGAERDGTPEPAARADGAGNLAVRVPGRLRELRPLVLLTRTDRLDPPSLAGLAATLAVPALLVDSGLDRDVIVVLADDGRPSAATDGAPPPQRPGARSWFDRQRRHDVHAVVVIERVRPSRWAAPGADLLRVAGIECDARMAPVADGAAPADCRLLLARHAADGLPFAEHEIPYLRVGAAHDPTASVAASEPLCVADLERVAAHAARLAATLLARLDVARLPGPYGGLDTTTLELAAVGAALGDRFDVIGGPPRTSADVERLLVAGEI